MQEPKIKLKKIIAVTTGVLPFYFFVVIDKIIYKPELSVHGIFLVYMPVTAIALGILLLLNHFLLNQKISDYNTETKKYLQDIAIAFLLMVGTTFLNIAANLFFADFFPKPDTDKMLETVRTLEVLKSIFNNPFYTFLFLIPFIWITQTFLVFSKVFLLKNLWDIAAGKAKIWAVLIISSLFFSLPEIDKGTLSLIVSFFTVLFFNITYFYYRRIHPLIIAAILSQSIQMIDFWISLQG